jgi:uncharacterized membrane protein (UPF0127 family)
MTDAGSSEPTLDLSEYPVAESFRSRLRGLAWRPRAQVGSGLLIPRCASVHTFGMRFELDVYFLDREGRILSVRRRVPPRRVLWCRGAAAVLEIPSSEGGEIAALGALTTHAARTRRPRQPRRL